MFLRCYRGIWAGGTLLGLSTLLVLAASSSPTSSSPALFSSPSPSPTPSPSPSSSPSPTRPLGLGRSRALGRSPDPEEGPDRKDAVVGVRRAQNWLWTRYTDPRFMNVSDHLEEEVFSEFFGQKLDHASEDDSRLWQQNYKRNNASYAPGPGAGAGPAFVMVAGAADYTSDWLRAGFMADLARKYKADRFFFSTRFYDPRYPPLPDTSAASLKYLTSQQILQDVRALLEHLRSIGYLGASQPVILFGAGYGGAIASWARLDFPHLVHGAVVSGGVVLAKYELSEYFPAVENAMRVLHETDLQCSDTLRTAYESLDVLLKTSAGIQKFNDMFEPCVPLTFPLKDLDKAQIVGYLASFMGDFVQENVDSENNDTLYVPCYDLRHSPTPLEGLANSLRLSEWGECFKYTFEDAVSQASKTNWESQHNIWGLRPWLWQQCSELGLFATTPDQHRFPYSVGTVGLAYYKKLCYESFGVFDNSQLVRNIDLINKQYGGKEPKASNLVFVKGDLDPWKSFSPDDDNKYVFTVRRASHAHDMFKPDIYDPPRLKAVRKRVTAIIGEWIGPARRGEDRRIFAASLKKS